jgi:hypothetical protein
MGNLGARVYAGRGKPRPYERWRPLLSQPVARRARLAKASAYICRLWLPVVLRRKTQGGFGYARRRFWGGILA